MTPDIVINHIDGQVIGLLDSGEKLSGITNYLVANIKRYKGRESYMEVSQKYLIRNWSRIAWKKRMVTMLAMQSQKRVDDIQWLLENQSKFGKWESKKLYKILSLKDKLKALNQEAAH